ncbi:MAG: substrate-binding domain-containing protein [Verrucomicrobiales bacterium]|jgi:DNA-binding LacI/PurR family transcriptional regulator|nr:substrate-binding domain-containing protein [Verrucomicrobiales bacterium]
MAMSLKKSTTRLSSDSKDRAIALLKSLIRVEYFSDALPSEVELSRQLRIPRSAISFALQILQAEGFVTRALDGAFLPRKVWERQAPSGLVGFVANAGILGGWYSIFQDWLIGFEQLMFSENYQTRLVTEFFSVEHKIEKVAQAWQDGVMGFVFASHTEPALRQHVVRAEIPSAIVGSATIDQEELGCITSNNRHGIEKIIRLLAAQNHTDIGYYTVGLEYHDGFRERYYAYQFAMHRRGLMPRMELAFSEPHSEISVKRAAEIFYGLSKKPSVIVCGSDREAYELAGELKQLGFEVPRHIGVTGFDNNHYGQILEPAMTTIDISAVEMGRVAANYLLNEMQLRQMPVKIELPVELIPRNSVHPLLVGKNRQKTQLLGIATSNQIISY